MQPSSNAAPYYGGSSATPAPIDQHAPPAPDPTAKLLADACYSGDLAAVQGMIAAGCDVNSSAANGATALVYAARRGHPDIVAALLHAGADVNACGQLNEQTPLMAAASSGSLDVMQVLLAWPGIDLDQADRYGSNALTSATGAQRDEPIMCLLKAGASLTGPRDCRYGMLEQAIRRGNVEMARLIAMQCCRETEPVSWCQNTWRRSALALAAREKCAGIVECLLYPEARSDRPDCLRPAIYNVLSAQREKGGHAPVVRSVCDARDCYASVPAQPESGKKNAFQSYRAKVGDRSTYLETIAIADLFACPLEQDGKTGAGEIEALSMAVEPLSILTQLIGEIRHRGHLLEWCDNHRIFLVIGSRLSDLLNQSAIELALLANGGSSANPQQEALYHAAALNMLQQAQRDVVPATIYTAAGLSQAGVERLAHVAQCQLDVLRDLSGRMMVALAEPMFEQLMPACRQQTDPDAGVNVQALQNSLARAGFLPPLAHAVARSWEAALRELNARPLNVPPGATIGQVRKLLDDATAGGHVRHFAAILPVVLRQQELVAQFRLLMTGSPASAGVLDHLFQVQCDQLRQYCEQPAQL